MSDAPQQFDLTGQIVASQFKVLNKLGAGGMGAVYLAEQIDMARKVVVKVMHPELTAGSQSAVERFKREARSVAQLNHPNIVQVYVFGQTDAAQLYIAMEYVDGRTLTDEIRREGRLAQTKALRILDQVASALTEAHAAGIVHRDLKPDNIMLTARHGNPDYVKVLDFGIAKLLRDDSAASAPLTQAGMVFGTPQYMAPEQVRNERLDARTDLYSLGIIFYEMVTGQHPFQSETAVEYLIKHTTEEVVMPSVKFGGSIPMLPRLESILGKCLAKKPEERFQSAAELQRAIRTTLRDFPDAAREFPTPGASSGLTAPRAPLPRAAPVAKPTSGKKDLWLWLVVLLIVLGGAGGGVAWWLKQRSASTPAESVAAADETPTPKERPKKKAPEPEAEPDEPKKDEPKKDEPPVVVVPQPKLPLGGDLAPEPKKDPAPSGPPAPPAAEPIDGIPVPQGASLYSTSPQALVLKTEMDPLAALAFYKAEFVAKCDGFTEFPNGVMPKKNTCPMSSVSVVRSPMGILISIAKSVLLEPPKSAGKVIFSVPIIDGAVEMTRMANMVVLTSKRPIAEIMDFYQGKYSSVPKITVIRTSTDTPVLVVNADEANLEFKTLTVTKNPMDGGVMITIMKDD